MVQSPFRDKKPPKQPPPLFSNGPSNQKQQTVRVGGSDSSKSSTSSIGNVIRNMFSTNSNENDLTPSKKPLVAFEEKNDIEAAREDSSDEESISPSVEENINVMFGHKPRGRSNGPTGENGMGSIMRSLSPKRENADKDGDVFMTPLPELDEPEPPKKQKNVWIGGKTIIGETSVPIVESSELVAESQHPKNTVRKANRHRGTMIPASIMTLSSFDSSTTNGSIESFGEESLSTVGKAIRNSVGKQQTSARVRKKTTFAPINMDEIESDEEEPNDAVSNDKDKVGSKRRQRKSVFRPGSNNIDDVESDEESGDEESAGKARKKRKSNFVSKAIRTSVEGGMMGNAMEGIKELGSEEETSDEEDGNSDSMSSGKRGTFVSNAIRASIEQGQPPGIMKSNEPKSIGSTAEGGRKSVFSTARRRMSKNARTRLTMSEVNSTIQPGRRRDSMEKKAISLPKAIDFFRRVEMKLIGINVLLSLALTALVLFLAPEAWQTRLKDASLAVSILGGFLSFTLVFRTQTCYNRWWEARSMWGKITAACINIAAQARTWFGDEDLVDRFLTYVIVYPYACKAVLRGNPLVDLPEEGPRFLSSGTLTDAELGAIIRHGKPPFVILEVLRRAMYEALDDENECLAPPNTRNGALASMEKMIWDMNLSFGACMKVTSTRMPASYTVFMRSFVTFFFILATLTWAPKLKWFTPIITGFMVFLINTVIVIGDQMMQPFGLQWAGLPLKKYCVIIESEVMSVSRRHNDIDCLFCA